MNVQCPVFLSLRDWSRLPRCDSGYISTLAQARMFSFLCTHKHLIKSAILMEPAWWVWKLKILHQNVRFTSAIYWSNEMHILMQYIAGNFNIEFMKWKWYKASRTKDVFFFSFKNYIKPCCPAPWYLFEVYTTKIGTGVRSIFSPHQNQQRVSIINKYLVKTTSNRHPICPSYFEF